MFGFQPLTPQTLVAKLPKQNSHSVHGHSTMICVEYAEVRTMHSEFDLLMLRLFASYRKEIQIESRSTISNR